MGAGELILSLLVVIIIVIIGIVIYFNFNNLFPGIKNIFTPPPPPPETSPPPPPETSPPPTDTPKPDTKIPTIKPPKPDTRTPKPDTRPPRPDTQPPKPDCSPFKPPFDTPKVPIPKGVMLDIMNTNKDNLLIQDNGNGRIVRENGVITVSMEPGDVDPVTKKSDRQRNEISIKNSNMILDVNKKGSWACYFKLNNSVSWDIKQGHYHIIQIKSLDQDQPAFTVSINGTNICARNGEGSGDSRYDVIQPVCSAVNIWIPFAVQINNTDKNGSITYNINGKIGTYKLTKPLKMFMKVGQYRAAPNNIKYTTSSSYKDICFLQES